MIGPDERGEPVRAGRFAVFLTFAMNGAVWGSWSPRVPAIAHQVGADVGALGLSLFGASIGMVVAASFAGRICAHVGARALVLVSALATAVVLPVIALVTSPLRFGLVLAALGASVGTLDVAMNIAAVTAVRVTARPIMPIFHAGFSFGALAGSAGAALAAANGIALLPHLGTVAACSVVAALAVARHVPKEPPTDRTTRRAQDRTVFRRPVLWLLGAIALCSAIVEGASGDWSALFAVTERGLDEGAAAVTFSVFSVAMAITRLLGERVERRWGANRALVGGSLLAAGGLGMAVLVPHAAATFAGFALAGSGLAFAFPVALELAGAAGRRADGTGGEQEIGFVTTIAYSGFLIGPPLIGGIAHVTNLAVALGLAGVIAALIAPAALAVAAARRREEAGRQVTADSVGA
jgi:fucose permease